MLATGARERPRAARMIPGDRPHGVYTTGQLQQAVYGYNQSIGRRAVIVGAEHVSYSAAVTLHHAGARVTAMLTEQPRQQSYAAFHLAARLRYRFPIHTRTHLARIIGHGRVEAVEIDGPGGMRTVECDTVVFTGDWVPDNELARRGGLLMAAPGGSPLFGADLRTSVPGVFAVGNLTHPVETADVVALEGAFAAKSVGRFLAGTFRTNVRAPASPSARWIPCSGRRRTGSRPTAVRHTATTSSSGRPRSPSGRRGRFGRVSATSGSNAGGTGQSPIGRSTCRPVGSPASIRKGQR